MSALHYENFINKLNDLIDNHKKHLGPAFVVEALVSTAVIIAYNTAPCDVDVNNMIQDCVEYTLKNCEEGLEG